MKTIGIAALAVALMSSGAAYGADVYSGDKSLKDDKNYVSGPIANWSGMYVGVHGGWANGDWTGELQYMGGEAGYEDDVRNVGGDGWLGGLQIGFNRQIGKIVLGLETDASYSDFSGSGTFATDDLKDTPDGFFSKKHDLSMEWFGTARARAGYSFGRFMPYVTGGLAWARTKGELEISYPLSESLEGKVSTASVDETHIGWTAGAGVETIIAGGLSLKVEYLHVDLGEEAYNFRGTVFNGQPFNTDSFKSDLQFDVIRAGLNYRF